MFHLANRRSADCSRPSLQAGTGLGGRLTSVWVDSQGMGAIARRHVLREIERQSDTPQCHVLPRRVVEHGWVADIR